MLIFGLCLSAGLLSCGGETGSLTEALSERATHVKGPDRVRIARALVRAGQEFEVDPLLLLAVAEEESRVRLDARSKKDALGLLQIQAVTAKEVAERNGIAWRGEEQLFDLGINARIGAAYLADLRERFGSWDLALTAYNLGPGKARRLRGRQPSSRYSARVLKRYEELGVYRQGGAPPVS